MRLVWLAPAEGDLASVVDFIAAATPTSARGVFATIGQAVRRLKTFPQSGRPGRVADTRELVVPGLPYIVVYQLTQQAIRIVAVFHTSRQWPDRFPTA